VRLEQEIVIRLIDHEPIILTRAPTFPPKPGAWFRCPDKIVICCPECRLISGIMAPPHHVNRDGTLAPSWVCPSCDVHAMVTLDDLKPSLITCATCGHPSHVAVCRHEDHASGVLEPCPCQDGPLTGWEPEPVVELEEG
jgi:hypothetical protein